MKTNEKRILALCEGRHEMPSDVEGSIFPQTIEDPFDFEGISKTVKEKLYGIKELDLYVTGLTVLTVEVIKYCVKNEVDLTLFHYNTHTGAYDAQRVCGHIMWCNSCDCECPCHNDEITHTNCDAQSQYECGGMDAKSTFVTF